MATFTSRVVNDEAGPFDTFGEAFADFWKRMMALADSGATHIVFETACWIEGDFNGKKMPVMFYDAKEFAYDNNLLDDNGDLVQPPPQIDEVKLLDFFVDSLERGAVGVVAEALDTLAEAMAT